jgi:hypothetical protein
MANVNISGNLGVNSMLLSVQSWTLFASTTKEAFNRQTNNL